MVKFFFLVIFFLKLFSLFSSMYLFWKLTSDDSNSCILCGFFFLLSGSSFDIQSSGVLSLGMPGNFNWKLVVVCKKLQLALHDLSLTREGLLHLLGKADGSWSHYPPGDRADHSQGGVYFCSPALRSAFSPAGAPAENLDCLPWPILQDVPWTLIFESSAQGMDKNPAVLFRGFLLS